MLIGVARQRLPARVDHDQLGAALGRILDIGRGYRMIDGRIGADHDDHIGVHRGGKRRRHRARIQPLHQRCDRGGVAQPRAVIDVVGAEAGAHQLLEQIGLFVRSLGRTETGQRLDPLLIADLEESLGGDVECLLPGGFAEMRERVGRIDLIVGILLHIRQPHKRLGQAIGMVNIVEAEAALDAEPVVIGRAVAALGIDHLVVLDLVGDLAADAAIRAQRIDFLVRIGDACLLVIEHHSRHQRAGRTGLHAFAASDAGRFPHRIVEIEHDL